MNDIDVVNVTISEPIVVRAVVHTGVQGPPGGIGDPGQDGAAATVVVGSVTTGAAGTNASVENVGTPTAAVLNITIPRGDTGAPGEHGQGVPIGGTAGQVLAKKTGTDYDTEWKDAASGSVSSVNGQSGVVVLGASDVGASASDHTHELLYAALSHDHSGVYSPADHNHSGVYAAASHNHTGTYEPANSNIQSHVAATGNPHGTTAADVGAMATTHPANAITALGTSGTSTAAAREDDARFTDSRTPTAHKSSHASGGSDALTAADIGAAVSGHNHDGAYATASHNHDLLYAALSHDHTGVYSPVAHNHDSAYSASGHNHAGTYEPILGNPASDGLVLASTAAGARSWVTASGGATTLDGLTDVVITTPANGQVLQYNSTTGQWENVAASGGSLDFAQAAMISMMMGG